MILRLTALSCADDPVPREALFTGSSVFIRGNAVPQRHLVALWWKRGNLSGSRSLQPPITVRSRRGGSHLPGESLSAIWSGRGRRGRAWSGVTPLVVSVQSEIRLFESGNAWLQHSLSDAAFTCCWKCDDCRWTWTTRVTDGDRGEDHLSHLVNDDVVGYISYKYTCSLVVTFLTIPKLFLQQNAKKTKTGLKLLPWALTQAWFWFNVTVMMTCD